jgi:hypothetical protein
MDRYGGRQNPFDDRGASDGGYGGPQQSYGQSYGGNQYNDQYGGTPNLKTCLRNQNRLC